MAWLLDTNVWIHYLKNSQSPIRDQLARRLPADIVSCSVVRAELLHGAQKYGRPERRVALVVQTLAPYLSRSFDDAAAARYADLRHRLESQGQVIGPHDLLIAAICLVHDLTLVSANTGEFSRVDGLRLEDWTVPAEA